MSENLKINADGVKDLLKTAKDGSPYPTIDNAVIVFRNNPFFKGKIKYKFPNLPDYRFPADWLTSFLGRPRGRLGLGSA